MPSLCGCGKDNSYNHDNHTLSCPLGGYTSMGHNALRDTEAAIMREVCRDVNVTNTELKSKLLITLTHPRSAQYSVTSQKLSVQKLSVQKL